MKQRRTNVLVLGMGMLLLGLLAMQFGWVRALVGARSDLFDEGGLVVNPCAFADPGHALASSSASHASSSGSSISAREGTKGRVTAISVAMATFLGARASKTDRVFLRIFNAMPPFYILLQKLTLLTLLAYLLTNLNRVSDAVLRGGTAPAAPRDAAGVAHVLVRRCGPHPRTSRV